MNSRRVGVLGARSLVGQCLVPLLLNAGWRVTAFSRQSFASNHPDLEWRTGYEPPSTGDASIHQWISLLPIWVLPDFFPLLQRYGAQRIVALSSTSRFVKCASSDSWERAQAASLIGGENALENWTESVGRQWVVVRPTLVYGLGRDKNVSEIARFIKRFGFFPLVSGGRGLRQPIHANDVASACATLIDKVAVSNRTYEISGADTLTYRDMVIEIFQRLGRRPKFLYLPLWIAKAAIFAVRLNPKYRHWSASMFERMGQDLVFGYEQAALDFSFHPRKFSLGEEDLAV